MAHNDDDIPRNRSARPDRPRPRPNSGMQPRRRAPAPEPSEHDGERIAKVIARAGLTSRRDAEDWIVAGRVSVNGKIISSPALNIGANDRVTVDGKPLPQRERTRLFLYHKPAGLVTTNADPEGRPTIFDRLPTNLPRLLTVGRLDIGTEGLLLLTNDGGLARVLELPETGWLRRYRVRALGRVTQPDLDALRRGITVEGIHYGPIEATLDREQGSNVWLTFAIREGKNREVRNVLGHLGLQVNRLIRVSYGPFQITELGEGEVEEVRTRVLREQLGERLIEEANCDFSAAIVQRPDATLLPPPSRDERRDTRRRDDGERPRDDFDDKRSHRDFRGDAFAEAPKGRPRRGHAWRDDDAPLRRHYRGEQKAEHQPDLEAPQKRTGLLKDRKGRNVLVERIGTPKPPPVKKGPPKGAYGKRPFKSRDERPDGRRGDRPFNRDDRPVKPHGERFDKPRGPRSDRPQGDRPFRRDDRPGKPHGERFDKPRGPRSDRPQGDRPFRRDDRPGKPHGERFDKPRGPRSDRPQGDRPFRRDDRPGKPHGERFDKPRGPRSDRPQGDRPFRRDDRPGKPHGERFDKPRGPRSDRPQGDRPFRRDDRPDKPSGPKPFKGRPRKPDRGSGPRPSRPR